jgi:hypothetical protein
MMEHILNSVYLYGHEFKHYFAYVFNIDVP